MNSERMPRLWKRTLPLSWCRDEDPLSMIIGTRRMLAQRSWNYLVTTFGQHIPAAVHSESNWILGVCGAAKIDCSMPKQQRSAPSAFNRVACNCA